jgi:hypothetical protein
MNATRATTVFMLLAISMPAHGDVTSGPAAGEAVKDLRVFGVVGPVEGKDVNYVKERQEAPTVYAFVQSEFWSRPMARFLKTLDMGAKDADDKAAIVAVWLSEKPDDQKDYLPKAQMSLQFQNTALAVYPGEKSGPDGWGINTDAHLTIVVVNKGKVAASFAYQSVNETDVDKVREALKKAVGKKE